MQRSAKHAVDATMWGRLERLVRRAGCRRRLSCGELAENRSPEARTRTQELQAGPVRNDSIWSDKLTASQSPFPKPSNSTHAMCERAMQTWTKRQRADNLSEEQRQPKPMNHRCEQHNYTTLFYRLTPELSRPVTGRRTRASVAQKHVADATTWGRLERIVRRLPGTRDVHVHQQL